MIGNAVIIATLCAVIAAPVQISGDRGYYPLGEHLEILEDPTGALTIGEVSSTAHSSRFRPAGAAVPNFGFTRSTYWARFKVDRPADFGEPLLLELAYPLMDRIWLYLPREDGTFAAKNAGYVLPFRQREINHRNFAFILEPLAPGQHVYLKAVNQDRMELPLAIWTAAAFHRKDHTEQYVLGIYYGLMIVMLFFNFFLFVSVRDRSYLDYVLFIFAFIFFQSTQNGIWYEYFWPALLDGYSHYIPLSIALVLFATAHFCQGFLDTAHITPRLDRALSIVKYALLASVLLPLVVPYPAAILFEIAMTLVTLVLVLAAGAMGMLGGYRPARYYMVAWSAVIVGAIIYALRVLALLPNNLFTTYAIQAGSAVQVFLLSLGIGDRINMMRREKEEAQQQAIENLRKADLLKDEFLANTSHELRTPLNGIIGIAESLIDGAAGSLTERARDNLSMIQASGKRLASLVNDILDFSKLKNRDIELNLAPLDMHSLVSVVLELSRTLTASADISLTNEVPGDAPAVWADENRVQQILHNLVGNAVKFTERGGITVSAKAAAGPGGRPLLAVSVRDTGAGIPADKLEAIFNPFEQADGSISRLYGGTGIGLTITRDLVRLHGGDISVESKPGGGSVFTFTLPLAGEGAQERPGAAVRPTPGAAREREAAAGPAPEVVPEEVRLLEIQAKGDDRRAATVLVVDDDPINLQVLENHLSLSGHRVIKSQSGTEAIEKIESGLMPDLVLLDVMMPRMNGYEVSRLLREKYSLSDLPIIMLTAKDRVADVVTGFNAGANDYLSKPFDKTELIARVATLISLKEAVRESRKLVRLEQDIEVARKIQRSSIPRQLPVIGGLRIAALYRPMEKVGGDFYDFHTTDGGIGILISDVSGHGVPAALITSMVKIVFYMLRGHADAPETLLGEMNAVLSGNIERQFLTAGYAYLDMERKRIRYASAGHPPLLVVRRDSGEAREIKPHGTIIGWKKGMEYARAEEELAPGDRVVMYTDGIIEAANGARELFGEEAFREFVVRNRALSGNELKAALIAHLREWSGSEEFEDDLTILVIDVL